MRKDQDSDASGDRPGKAAEGEAGRATATEEGEREDSAEWSANTLPDETANSAAPPELAATLAPGGTGESDARRAATGTPDRAVSSGGVGLERGDKLDRFIVLDRLGEGGMGVVVSAYDPDLDRKVAIKVLRADVWGHGTGTRAQGRLLREAQALAKLSHPNVVTVYEVGTYSGRVFLVMEYVDGCDLSCWLEQERRSWRAVIDVIVAAGHGVAAAHDAGLVHRDIKPENILIGKDGRVRVTDFGLVSAAGASAESSAGAESGLRSESSPLSTSLTRTGALLGTPKYMAPEQHERKPVDAKADQFALCVALYDALYRRGPFEGKSYSALMRNVVAGRLRPPPPDSGVPLWVRNAVARGLETRPEDRYPTIGALIAALTDDPNARRRRQLRIGAIVIAFMGLAALSVVGLARDRGQKLCRGARHELGDAWDDAKRDEVKAAFIATSRPYAEATFTRVEEELDAYAAEWTAMWTEACEATRVRGHQSQALMDLRMHCLERRRAGLSALTSLFAAQPDIKVLDRSAQAASNLDPIASCADVDALTAAVPPPEDPATRDRVGELRTRLDEAQALQRAGKYKDGLTIAEKVVEEARPLDYAPLVAESLYLLGVLQSEHGDAAAAEKTLLLAVRAAARSRDDVLVARTWVKVVYVIGYGQGRYADALALRDTAETAIVRAGGDEGLRAELLNHVCTATWSLGKYDEARPACDEALAIRERLFGSDSTSVATTLNSVGIVAERQGKYDEARALHERAHAIWTGAVGAAHPKAAMSLNNLGTIAGNQGNYEEARDYFTRSLGIWEKSLGPDHPNVAWAYFNLGALAERFDRFAEALGYYQRVLAIVEKAYSADHAFVAYPLTGIGSCQVGLGQPEQAIPLLERALALRKDGSGDPTELAETQFTLARALADAGREKGRASELARQARATYAAAGESRKKDLDTVDTWLASARVQ